MFGRYLTRWELVADGQPIETDSSRLLPVRRHGVPAMLKLALNVEEARGGRLMTWWEGHGAARVFAEDGAVLLLERAGGDASLAELARGNDDEACRIICTVVAKLHAFEKRPSAELVPLERWFRDLEPAAAAQGGMFVRAARATGELLASAARPGVLHGDIHHGNILDFGDRGWLAIDPKGLIGERAFDYANIFCNPDAEMAADPARFARRIEVVAAISGLDPKRLLQWILAWSGLSAAWCVADGDAPEAQLAVGELAAAELCR